MLSNYWCSKDFFVLLMFLLCILNWKYLFLVLAAWKKAAHTSPTHRPCTSATWGISQVKQVQVINWRHFCVLYPLFSFRQCTTFSCFCSMFCFYLSVYVCVWFHILHMYLLIYNACILIKCYCKKKLLYLTWDKCFECVVLMRFLIGRCVNF